LEADPRGLNVPEDPWLLARELFSPCYIGGWTAAQHWEFTEQLFRSTFVASAASSRRSEIEVARTFFHVAHVPLAQVDMAELLWRGRERVRVSSRELTIVDALVTPAWMGGVRHLAEVLSTYHGDAHWNPSRLLRLLQQRHAGAAYKRLGWLAEALFPDEHEIIAACQAGKTAGLVALDPAVKAAGRIAKRWGLRINVDVHRGG
jgi:predicted transcriptional regulator of viral defense system